MMFQYTRWKTYPVCTRLMVDFSGSATHVQRLMVDFNGMQPLCKPYDLCIHIRVTIICTLAWNCTPSHVVIQGIPSRWETRGLGFLATDFAVDSGCKSGRRKNRGLQSGSLLVSWFIKLCVSWDIDHKLLLCWPFLLQTNLIPTSKINIDPASCRGWKISFHSNIVIFRVYFYWCLAGHFRQWSTG